MGVPVSDTVKIINEHSQLLLGVAGEATTEGTLIDQYTDTGKKHQQWQLEPVEPAGPDNKGFYNIKNVNSGMSLEVVGDSKNPGGDIVQRPYGDGPWNRQWELVPVDGKTDVYKIMNRSSRLVLDNFEGQKEPPAPVKQYESYGDDGRQQWKIHTDTTKHEQASQQTSPRQHLIPKTEDAHGRPWSLSATFKVTVKRASDNQPVADLPIKFVFAKWNSELCSTVTNTEGVAECDSGTKINLLEDVASLAFGYDAVFDGDTVYEPFKAHGRILLL
jgi:hypothetical protein